MDQKLPLFNDLSRRDLRSLIFHILYIADCYDYQMSIDAIIDNINRGFDFDIPMDSEVVKTAAAIIEQRETLDENYKPFLAHWRLERLSIVTKLILRYGVWELANSDLEATIIINEAVELAKCFAEDDAFKFINGVLDEAAKHQNKAE